MGVQIPAVGPRSDGFGAQITGVNLAEPLSAEALNAIKVALTAHSVLWFPGQPLGHEALEAFTLQFGELGNDLPYVAPLDDQPHILEVRRDADEKTAVFGGYWHSDGSFQAQPPAITILHAKVIPPTGGDTLFADGYRAFDALNPKFREQLGGLAAIHSAAGPFGDAGVYAQENGRTGMRMRTSREAEATVVHPLVRTHPVSGRRALFINPTYTIGVDELEQSKGEELLAFLYRHMLQARFIYRHVWAQDMLTLWDNRCAMHNATGGYDGYARVLHRTIVAGETPSPGDAFPGGSDDAPQRFDGLPLTWWTFGRRVKHALPAWVRP